MNKTTKSYAVFIENALEVKPMQVEWNRRVFNTTEVQHGEDIRRDDDGVVSLAAGTYHIVGCSIVNYFPDLPDNALVESSSSVEDPKEDPFEKPSHPGYCMLRHHPSRRAITTGTISNADYMLPSLFDIFIEVEESTEIILEHQVGPTEDDITDVYLQVGGNISTNHVFARISIEKLD